MIKSLIILGGGTSGLISALMLKSGWPDLKITMIESSALGIIGVGEGSTEHWKRFMKQADISVFDMMRNTGATFKIGIKFTNWNGDGKHYFHSLAEQFGTHSRFNGIPYTLEKLIAENFDPLDTVYKKSMNSMHSEPLHDSLAQYHFDTFKLNKYFHDLCAERGIELVDTKIDDVVLDEQGYVSELVGNDGQRHSADFFIDCSGFRRIIGSKIDAKWLDKTDQLPLNSALAFPTAYQEHIPSYTESTALSSGWVWRIPTQDRFGNGYVFCDSFIDETKAYDEVSQHYKQLGISDNIEIGKKIKFGAGHVEKFWIKNCVMTGLSGIFVEPLEASSMGTTIQQTFLLLPSLYYYVKGDTHAEEIYNKQMSEIAENIVDFIQLHYFTKRNDSEFWQWVNNNIKYTDFNRENMSFFKKHGVHTHYFQSEMLLFRHLNFMQVMHGLGMFDTESLNKKWSEHMKNRYDTVIQKELFEGDKWHDQNATFYTHREAIEMIKQRNDNVQYKF